MSKGKTTKFNLTDLRIGQTIEVLMLGHWIKVNISWLSDREIGFKIFEGLDSHMSISIYKEDWYLINTDLTRLNNPYNERQD